MRAGDREEVRESRRRQPQVGVGAFSPGLLQADVVAAAEVDASQRAGEVVVPRRVDDRVDVMGPGLGLDAVGGDPDQRVLQQADQRHVRPVERRPEVGVGDDAFAADRVVDGGQLSRDLRIIDDVSDLVPDELGHDLVRLEVGADVDEGGEEEVSTELPVLLQHDGALRLGRVQDGVARNRQVDARERAAERSRPARRGCGARSGSRRRRAGGYGPAACTPACVAARSAARPAWPLPGSVAPPTIQHR